MNKQEAIKVLAMENDLMQFNPNTGEDRPIEFQSKDNQDLYQANLLAISALEHQLTDMWIPCKDRLPTPEEYQRNDCRFIVTDGNRIHEDIYDYMADGYIQPIWIYSKCQPIAWHNMPPRYKEPV